MIRFILAVIVLVLATIATLEAKKIWKTVDAEGITHYSDQPPPDDRPAEVIRVRAESQPIAALRVDRGEVSDSVVVTNRLSGPIEVELRFEQQDNVASVPALPARAVVSGTSESVIADLAPHDPQRGSSYNLAMRAVPGDPSARPDRTPYGLPVDLREIRIDQGFGGAFSHNEPEARHAVDIAAPEGTPVLAARDGVVMQVEDDFEGAGLDREKFGARANHIRLVHADGSMTVYAHLAPESVVVTPGRRVRAGQRIAATGNTGFSSGPHLHFAVQVNRGMRIETIPFELVGPDGLIPIPQE